jgi:Fe-S-cluster containining protein
MCPVLDPETGACVLYEARPVTCRVFGAATRTAEGVAACEKCYAGWSDEAIAAQATDVDPDGLEAALIAELEARGHKCAASVAEALCLTETP